MCHRWTSGRGSPACTPMDRPSHPKPGSDHLVRLDVDRPIWDRVFTVSPLVVVGTKESDGTFNLAPKHMATPLSWDNYFGFVCNPSHRTYVNIGRERAFTVSFPNPDQVVLASLAASPRCDDQSKPVLASLPTFPAKTINGRLLRDGYLYLECELDRIIDGFGQNSLIAGRVVSALVSDASLRGEDRDDQDLLQQAPILAYLPPGRYAIVDSSKSFPFPAGMRKSSP